MAEKEIFNVFLQIGRNYASFLFECMRISQNLFLFGGEGGGGRIYFDLSFLLSFLPFPFFSGYIQFFWHFIDRLSFSWNFGCYNFSGNRKFYLEKLNR